MSRNVKGMMKQDGFTLIELIVVIGILAVLMAIAGIYGNAMMVSSQVESQTREMFSDLMNARVSAMQRNRVFFVTLDAGHYAIYEDTFPSPDGNGDLDMANDLLVKQKTTTYALATSTTMTFLKFTTCGTCDHLVSVPTNTLHIVSTANASFDCIVLATTRILMGKWNGTDCTPQ
jgi:prepilin-type N-terminal cleavage/methylation domain-containing protein